MSSSSSQHLLRRLQQKLDFRKECGMLRSIEHRAKLSSRLSADSASSMLEPLIDFSSNDYLGLASNHELVHRIQACHSAYVEKMRGASKITPAAILGSTGSRLLTGNCKDFIEVERFVANFHGQSYALIANSGWDMNFGLLASVLNKGRSFVLMDEFVHNSMRMGVKMAQCSSELFRHNNVHDLEQKLQVVRNVNGRTEVNFNNTNEQEIIILVESVYSMDGDVCPISEVLELAKQYGAMVIIDEAHGTGTIGNEGEGLISSLKLQKHPNLFGAVHTFGKAVGLHGAALVTSHEAVVPFLVNYASPIIYSTSLPIGSVLAIREAYIYMASCVAQRAHLKALITQFQSECVHLNIPCLRSDTAIQGVVIPTNSAVVSAAAVLHAKGFQCYPIRSPTVAVGSERLRIIIHAHNTAQQVSDLCIAIHDILSTEQRTSHHSQVMYPMFS